MSINKAQQLLQDRVITDLTQAKRDLREIKTRQPIGADILAVMGVPTGGPATASVTLAPNQAVTFEFTVVPANATLTQWNFLDDVRVDVNDAAHQFSNGVSLSAAQRLMRKYSWVSWGDSSDTTNIRVFKIRVENYDISPHDYYLLVRAYIPLLSGSA